MFRQGFIEHLHGFNMGKVQIAAGQFIADPGRRGLFQSATDKIIAGNGLDHGHRRDCPDVFFLEKMLQHISRIDTDQGIFVIRPVGSWIA